ncbi:unnamed protein product [Hermetia illucens]|uniref:Uncharacterized protein n=1 Tax=Hermetia illucens TaxID=343691 RepID=A0A7R8V0P2_HERIL|nr:unnamed protein product [Hermetia illucens]
MNCQLYERGVDGDSNLSECRMFMKRVSKFVVLEKAEELLNFGVKLVREEFRQYAGAVLFRFDESETIVIMIAVSNMEKVLLVRCYRSFVSAGHGTGSGHLGSKSAVFGGRAGRDSGSLPEVKFR